MSVLSITYSTPFREIAEIFLNKTKLLFSRREARLCEIEFYLKSVEHNDIYTHCSVEQSQWGKWYFHRTNKGGYREGTFKGLDITFGNINETQNIYFGTLIRSILIDDMFIEGPSNTVSRILTEYGLQKISEFTNGAVFDITENPRNLVLVPYDWDTQKIYIGPRIGLNPSKSEEFVNKNYRFLIYKNRVRKQKRTLKILT